jgi:myo-inositol-1(or 4)-monophosphatase
MRPSADLKVALKAAEAGAKVIRSFSGKKFKVRHKGEINLVTEVDEAAQASIVRVIQKAFPEDALLAEEKDLSVHAGAPRRWIIDPIDGTTNFAHGYPVYCVSVALEEKGKLKAGVIWDPTRQEVFTAEKGQGAFLNGKAIRVSTQKKLKASLLVTGFPYDLYDPAKDNLRLFNHLIFKAQAIRRDGSAALNLAYIACGRFDGFWELGLSPWDVAAGVLLIREAGGKVLDFEGKPYPISSPRLIAGNMSICKSLVDQIGVATSV